MNTKRLATALLRLLLVLSTTVPLSPQADDQPYFTLSSSESFAPGSTPSVQVSAYGVNALRIRVYRIHDPVQFMRQLEDAHQFGGSYPKPQGKLTLLERLRNWKHDLRRNIRYNLRQQFTESPRAHLFPQPKPGTAKGGKAAFFAEAPVLNSQQLVLSFLQPVIPTANRWDTEKVDIPVKQDGLYLVEAVNGRLRAYTILNISNVVLLTKTGRDQILYYVCDRTTGEPISNAEVTVIEKRDSTGTVLHTGPDGTADYPIHETPAKDVRTVAINGQDAALGDIEGWSFLQRDRNLTGVVYTDRPVYRPGDPVHFRAILRTLQPVGYAVPKQQSFAVQITDRDGKAIYQKGLSTNAHGILHDDLTLAKDAALGNYFIEVRSGDTTTNGNFEVQEYKKPEYEVHVSPETPRILQGQPTKITIDSRYYFGEPVTGAKVKYSIYKSQYWFPLWYEPDSDDEQNADQNEPNDYGYNSEAQQAEGELDADGKFTFTLSTDVDEKKNDVLYRIEAGVTDQAGREITGTGWIIATYGTFVLNLQPDRWFYQPNQTATFTVQARDYDRKPVSTPVHVELHAYHWRDRETSPTIVSTDVNVGPTGDGTFSVKLPSTGGDYRVIATAPSAGRQIEMTQYLWVSGMSGLYEGSAPNRAIQIVPDKKSYQAGDTAQILIATGKASAPVLVTVEGRDIRSHTVLTPQAGSAVFTYKITKDDEPGFFVSAQFVRDGVFYAKEKRIKVPPEEHRINIRLSTDKPQYQPGKPATYSIDVTTPDGKPAAETDLSLGVVDEAIYAIAKDDTPDLVNTFYGNQGDSVMTESSLSYYFSGEAGLRRMQLAALRPKSKLAQLKPEQLVQPKVRKYFPDTTFWAADLTTDSNGHAQAQFDFPDSLTTWRATARGSSDDDRYGSATLKTIVRKNLILRLAVPRFFVQGDEVVISAIAHNYLQTEKQARVTIKLEGLDVLNGAPTQDVTIPIRGEAKVDWRVKARPGISAAKLTAEALTNEESDALELQLPIQPPGVLMRMPQSGSIQNSGQRTLGISFPADAVGGSRSISIHLAPSVAGSIFNALDYLTSFPYGCVEQTMSSFLPDVVVTQVMNDLHLKQPIDPNDLAQKTQAGLDRLYGFHHDDGGWGWWVSDDSHPFMTAYVIDGLVQARKAGIAVNGQMIESADRWITQYFNRNRDIPPDLHAYMAYALAESGHPDTETLEQLYTHRRDLSSYGLALLGLTFEAVNDKRASAIASALAANVHEDAAEASWPASRDEMLDFSADITPETTAYATKLLSHEEPNNPLLPKAALWLVNHRDEGYWWSSTKQTAMVIYGLIDYIKTTKELNPDLKITVRVNGQDAGSAQFGTDNLVGTTSIAVDESKLRPDGNQVVIESSGSGRLYYSVSGDYYSNEPKAQNQGTIALNILRDYYKLVPKTSNGEILYDLQPLAGPVAQGDVLAVRLTVTGSEWRYLLIEDPIPAGAEFVKDDNLYHLASRPPWWEYWFTERENHDNRIAIFDSWFHHEQRQYFYVLKVVNPGLFHINPARVQPMYQPQYQATTGAATLEVK